MDQNIKRRKTRAIFLGGLQLGGDAPVVVQSMTNTDTRDVKATVGQIRELQAAGCEAVRLAVPDREAAAALPEIRKMISIPLIADIHFDHRLACLAIRAGLDGIRINPGNIGPDKIRTVVKEARERRVVIRIGVNSGSLEEEILRRHGGPTALAMVESALKNLAFIQDLGHDSLKLSLKSSDVPTMIEAYREISRQTDYPLHLGVTEAGTLVNAAIKSSLGIGSLLHEGIGDTIRVSVTGSPVAEMGIAWGILRALNLRKVGPDIISCPTCGRCEIDLMSLVEAVETRMAGRKEYLKVALMGCVVNGPGEAAEADVGIAGGKGMGVLFKKGKAVKKIRETDFLETLLAEIEQILTERTRD
ncbi:MAG: flavodoxin-dependent (E)-4-hydroxy-3-methylbut-2-enyl-diphosphate synthase [Smithellaceae bacterium]|nr:flavodoxin-dependent (E)-4-hydroxy-3-methylbut-2-enyl-diphosphate synthase [Smithellaceae bacterium]